MKNYTLLHLGSPRTGTTALWNYFKKHNEMAVSIEKEPIWGWNKDVESYLKSFPILETTKVIVDCTPIIVLLHKKRNYFRNLDDIESITRRCCLYTYRSDIFRRVISYLEVLLADYYLRNKNSILIRNGKISVDSLDFILKEYSNDFKLIQMIVEFFGEKNVFVVHLKEFNKRKDNLYRFLGISQMLEDLEHEKNQVSFENTVNYLNYLKGLATVRNYAEKIKPEIEKIIDRSREEMLKHYGFE